MGPRFAVTLSLLAAGCAQNGTPSQPQDPSLLVSRIQVDSVAIRTAESFPVQVFAHVTGVIGDGCASLLPVAQSRSGNVVTLEIQRQRPKDAICTQIAKLFDQQIRLEGEFRSGGYTLQVNGRAYPFRVD